MRLSLESSLGRKQSILDEDAGMRTIWTLLRGCCISKYFLLMLIAFGQVQLCPPEYVLPDGTTCDRCPQITCETERGDREGTFTAPHGDCHDCCTLVACHDDHKHAGDATLPGSVAALPCAHPTISLPRLGIWVALFTYVREHPPTGPPDDSLSRGPPSFLTA